MDPEEPPEQNVYSKIKTDRRRASVFFYCMR